MGALRRGWRHIRIGSAAAALFATACGGQPRMDDQMKRDLEAASASTMELAPTGGGQRVVSAIEQLPQAQPKPTTTRRVAAPTKTLSPDPAATRPTQRPAVNPPPPGGYKTIGEVLKNAPFPIKP
jgi:uncharacterized protein with LGFP repeats